jgi:hypothetical protein
MSRTEQPQYTVAETHGNIEIRDYAPMIVAEVDVSGERKAAVNRGFRMIAGYIFGGNQPAQKIAMTAPVLQQPTGGSWKVRFVMPKQYSLESLPAPNDPAVNLVPVGARRYAAIRFSGTTGEDNLLKHRELLAKFVAKHELKTVGEPVMAFYNPPWTLPFLRRNEILVELGG